MIPTNKPILNHTNENSAVSKVFKEPTSDEMGRNFMEPTQFSS